MKQIHRLFEAFFHVAIRKRAKLLTDQLNEFALLERRLPAHIRVRPSFHYRRDQRGILRWILAGEFADVPRNRLRIDEQTRTLMACHEIRERGWIQGDADKVRDALARDDSQFAELSENDFFELLKKKPSRRIHASTQLHAAQRQLQREISIPRDLWI